MPMPGQRTGIRPMDARSGERRPVRLDPSGSPAGAHTPAVRSWARLLALLWGFTGNRYVWFARPRPPVPIERRLAADDVGGAIGGATRRTARWWRT